MLYKDINGKLVIPKENFTSRSSQQNTPVSNNYVSRYSQKNSSVNNNLASRSTTEENSSENEIQNEENSSEKNDLQTRRTPWFSYGVILVITALLFIVGVYIYQKKRYGGGGSGGGGSGSRYQSRVNAGLF
jgi:ATP-dependent Zn protease